MNRARSRLRNAIRKNIRERSIADTTSGESVVVPADDIHEPEFRRDPSTGRRRGVYPGNREFRAGDEIPRPEGGSSGGGSEGSEDGEGEDSFAFTLSRDEFLDLLFEDLALPDMARRKLKSIDASRRHRAGFTTSGSHNRLNLLRSLRRSMVRRAALGRPSREVLAQIEAELARLEAGEIVPADGRGAEARIAELRERMERLRRRRAAVPWLDPLDLRFNRMEPRPEPVAQAVMFCLMDVSASMDEDMKGLAKRFFMLLHLFLERHYEHVEVVFIRHTQRAEEVDERTFFEDRGTGGTVVSSALREMLRIVEARYDPEDYNIYMAQASDGDNVASDVATCLELLGERILPLVQYMAYVEVMPGGQMPRTSGLWQGYASAAAVTPVLAMRRIAHAGDIFPVFRDLFRKEGICE